MVLEGKGSEPDSRAEIKLCITFLLTLPNIFRRIKGNFWSCGLLLQLRGPQQDKEVLWSRLLWESGKCGWGLPKWLRGQSLTCAAKSPASNAGVRHFHYDDFSLRGKEQTLCSPKKPDWGLGCLASWRLKGLPHEKPVNPGSRGQGAERGFMVRDSRPEGQREWRKSGF